MLFIGRRPGWVDEWLQDTSKQETVVHFLFAAVTQSLFVQVTLTLVVTVE